MSELDPDQAHPNININEDPVRLQALKLLRASWDHVGEVPDGLQVEIDRLAKAIEQTQGDE